VERVVVERLGEIIERLADDERRLLNDDHGKGGERVGAAGKGEETGDRRVGRWERR